MAVASIRLFDRHAAAVAIVLGVLPIALATGAWTLHLLDYDLSVAVAVGFIALAGLAVELGVMMVTYLRLALAERATLAEREVRALNAQDIRLAVLDEHCTTRALHRHEPPPPSSPASCQHMLSEGTGTEVMRRIAAPMFAGVLGAAVLALAVVPALFLLWHRRRVAMSAFRHQPQHGDTGFTDENRSLHELHSPASDSGA